MSGRQRGVIKTERVIPGAMELLVRHLFWHGETNTRLITIWLRQHWNVPDPQNCHVYIYRKWITDHTHTSSHLSLWTWIVRHIDHPSVGKVAPPSCGPEGLNTCGFIAGDAAASDQSLLKPPPPPPDATLEPHSFPCWRTRAAGDSHIQVWHNLIVVLHNKDEREFESALGFKTPSPPASAPTVRQNYSAAWVLAGNSQYRTNIVWRGYPSYWENQYSPAQASREMLWAPNK